ncbi:MAG: hypothetical protein JXM79_18810 [Sedimentisphaerales bacterium]|nr:hypothetical protein [Sedimentisphaerales bacterium]
MVQKDEKILWSKGRLALGLIFFLLCYAYLWIVVKPHLIYHGYGTLIPDIPEFVTGWRFWVDSLNTPGGLVQYLVGLFSQGYYESWLGALFIVLMALCLYALSRWHYAYIHHSASTVLPFFPAVMIVLIYNHYDHPLAACLTSSVGLLLSLIFEKIPIRRIPARMVVFCLMAVIGYWFAGAGSVFVFSLLTIIYLLFIRKHWIPAVLTFPILAVIIWSLAEYIFILSPKQAFIILMPFPDMTADVRMLSKILSVMLYIFIPATILLICFWKSVFEKDHIIHPKKTKITSKRKGRTLMRFGKRLLPLIPMVVLSAGLYFSYDGIHRQIVEMNYLSRLERWSDVLELGRRLPKNIYNIYCNHDINRALYHAGRLGYDMFCFPQNPHALLLTHEQEESSMTQLKMCDTYIELGNMNYAEKLASEFLAAEGRLGMVLEKLAWIDIIKGQEDTARIYLNGLKKDLIYRDKAQSMLRGLTNGFEESRAATIQRIASCIRRSDNPRLYTESIEEMLTGLLKQDPNNRMAFEYLMACYLLAGDLKNIAVNLTSLTDLGYQEIPTLYEEAMLIYQGMYGREPDLGTFEIKPETIERYNRFVRMYNSMQPQNRQIVLQQLIREFGMSYFFYYRFTVSSPAGTSQR